MKIFLSIFFLSIWSLAGVKKGRTYGAHTYSMLPTANFLTPTETYDPPDNWTSPLVVNLSSIDSHIQAGSLLKIENVGGYSDADGQPDDTVSYVVGVFLDSSGNRLAPGPESTAPPNHNTGTTDVPEDFVAFVNPDEGNIVEVPEGAVSIQFGVADHYFWDNTDDNGNFGVKITYPALKPKIYQVILDPKLEGNNKVDLVAGKNADVVVKLDASIDVAGENSLLSWGTGESFPVSADVTKGSQSTLTFQVNPVPSGSGFLGEVPMNIKVKDSSGTTVAEQSVKVEIHKTKAINLQFIPISGCFIKDDLFVGSTEVEAQNLINKSGPFLKALYPVADDDLTYSDITRPLAIATLAGPKTFGNFVNKSLAAMEGLQDLFTLQKIYVLEKYFSSTTQIIGVLSYDYLNYRGFILNEEDLTLGLAFVTGNNYVNITGNSALVYYDAPKSLAHELGHLYSLVHVPETTSGGDGYSNYNLPSSWHIDRGLLGVKTALMAENKADISYTNLFWMTRDEYLRILKENLQSSRSSKESRSNLSLKVESVITPDATFKIANVYANSDDPTENVDDGAYTYAVKDANGSILTSGKVNTTVNSPENLEVISFNISVPGNGVFIEVRRSDLDETYLGTIAIPVELIQEEVRYLSPSAVKGDYRKVRQKITDSLSKYRNSILSRDFKTASYILNSEFYNLVNTSVTDNYTSYFGIETGKTILNSAIKTSILRMANQEYPEDLSSNEFLKVEQKNQPTLTERSKIRMQAKKGITNSSYEIVFKVWFDGFEMNQIKNGKDVEVESPRITLGEHWWTAQSYVIQASTNLALNNASEKYKIVKDGIRRELDGETDPEKRQLLMDKIAKTDTFLLNIKAQYESAMKPIGAPISISLNGR